MYSQNKEEQYILDYWKGEKGTLLDIGANDGKTFSNSLALIERGWEADLVEPNPEAYKKLEALHKGNEKVTCYDCALSDYEGVAEIWYSNEDNGLVSSLYEKETKRWETNPYTNYTFTKAKVEVEHANLFDDTAYDFITIDCEGAELKILPHLCYEECRMVCVEWNSKRELEEAYTSILSSKGFNRILYRSPENLIYVK